MKHSYLQTAKFRAMLLFGIFLSTVTLLSSCSDGMQDLDGIQENAQPSSATVTDDSTLRFKTIDELENISVSDIPGDNSGYTLSELTYECVDTIELRALRFDVSAKLNSATQPEKIIRFSAEVGPELVSVEYYPGGEWVPTHDNMAHAYYPCVERYRNYSDGSRIGPDKFYDYGHFHWISQGIYIAWPLELYLSVSTGNWSGVSLSHEEYNNGIFYTVTNETIEINTNTTIISEDGKIFTGEDLIPHHPAWWNRYLSFGYRDSFSSALGNYYDNFGSLPDGYILDRRYSQDEETLSILNLCKDVPDVSPIPYPKDVRSKDAGWYFGAAYDKVEGETFATSSYHNYLIEKDEEGLLYGNRFYTAIDCYLQYLVIDGRIIHYDNLAKSDYRGIINISPTFSETKTSDGYNIHREASHKYLGANFMAVYDLQIKCTKGLAQVIDLSNHIEMEDGDKTELEKLNSSLRTTRGEGAPDRAERPDGKYVSIDSSLPNSIRSIRLN